MWRTQEDMGLCFIDVKVYVLWNIIYAIFSSWDVFSLYARAVLEQRRCLLWGNKDCSSPPLPVVVGRVAWKGRLYFGVREQRGRRERGGIARALQNLEKQAAKSEHWCYVKERLAFSLLLCPPAAHERLPTFTSRWRITQNTKQELEASPWCFVFLNNYYSSSPLLTKGNPAAQGQQPNKHTLG